MNDFGRLLPFMLVARRVRLPPLHHRCSRLPPRPSHDVPRRSQRTLFTSAVETLSEGFLDLAIALPFPPSLPHYSTTIILLTVVSRLAFTLPISIWVWMRGENHSMFLTNMFAFRLNGEDTGTKRLLDLR